MKIAILPYNVASDIDSRVNYLKRFDELEIKAYSIQKSTIIDSSNCLPLPSGLISNNIFIKAFAYIKYLIILSRIAKWADVIHWYWDLHYIPIINYPLDYLILKYFNKPGLIVWCGSEIRNPEIDFNINPYYKKEKEAGRYEYNFESSRRSQKTQHYFHKLDYKPLVFIGIDHYIDKNLFPEYERIFHAIDLNKFIAKYPSAPFQRELVIVHSASVVGGKGTKYVLAAIEKLKAEFNIKFLLLNKLPRDEALQIVSTCDIFIDQLITGGHGTAAVEAMALGKPVLCYLNPIILQHYPDELPIINVNVDNLYDQLRILLIKPEQLTEIGIKSRKYVEKYHEGGKNAENLLAIYKKLFNEKRVLPEEVK